MTCPHGYGLDVGRNCLPCLRARVDAADEVEKRHVREWQDSILRHEEKRDEEARMRETLERRIEELERALLTKGAAR